MPEWARGLDEALLKEHAGVFRSCHRPYVHGAFGLLKERDVATAMAEDRYTFVDDGKAVRAAAVFRRLTRPSKHEDYTGRAVAVGPGLYVSALAVDDEERGAYLLNSLVPTARFPAWVEVFEEDQRAKAVVQGCGFEHSFTKVAAGSEVKGMYVRGARRPLALPAVEEATLHIVDRHFLSEEWVDTVCHEVSRLNEHAWAQHYSGYNKRGSWEATSLRGYDPGDCKFIIKPSEMSKKWKADNPERMKARPTDTPLYASFPRIHELVDTIPGQKDRVRFMRLRRGNGELTRHADITDREAGVADGRVARLHVPIVTNDKVMFKSWDSRGREIVVRAPAGALMYLDQRKPHCVVNEGDSDRVHLVVDVVSGPELRKWLVQGM